MLVGQKNPKKNDVIVHHEVLTITFCALWTRSLACSWSLGHMSDLIGFVIHLCLHPCRPLRQMCASRDHVLHSLGTHPQIGPTHPLSDAFTQAGAVTHWAGWLLGGWIAWCDGSPCVRCSTFYWRPKGLGSEVRPPEAGSNSSSWIWKLTRFSQPSGPPYWERNKCACWEGAILV